MTKKGFTVIEGVVIVALVLVVVGIVSMSKKKTESTTTAPVATDSATSNKTTSGATTPAPATTTTNNKVSETADWKTYTNAKYGYTFKYPVTVGLTAGIAGGEGGTETTADTNSVGISVRPINSSIGNEVFSVSAPGIEFTSAAISNNFGAATKPENTHISSVTIAGVKSFKVIRSGDSAVVSTFYFLKNLSGTVLELTVLNSSDDAQKILSSFQLTK